MKEDFDTLPQDYFVILDYGVTSAMAMVDYADIIFNHIKKRHDAGTSMIAQIIKVSNPQGAYKENDLCEYLNDLLIPAGVKCGVLSSLERYSLVNAVTGINLRCTKGNLTFFCNTDDSWIVKYFIHRESRFKLPFKLSVITYGLFRESLITQIPKTFFDLMDTAVAAFKKGLRS